MNYLELAKKVAARLEKEGIARRGEVPHETDSGNSGTSLPKGFQNSPEHWQFRRLLIPSQAKPGHVDVWMVGERMDGKRVVKWWFAGCEPKAQ